MNDTPKDLRNYADYEIERMAVKSIGFEKAAVAEVLRLRKLVLKLTRSDINIPPNCS